MVSEEVGGELAPSVQPAQEKPEASAPAAAATKEVHLPTWVRGVPWPRVGVEEEEEEEEIYPGKAEEIYRVLVEECWAILVESQYLIRLELIKSKWLLGEVVAHHAEYIGRERGGRGLESLPTRLAKDLTRKGQMISPREVRRCIQFYLTYPQLGFTPEMEPVEVQERLTACWPTAGKQLSWRTIAQQLAITGSRRGMARRERIFFYSQARIGQIWTEADHQWLMRQWRGSLPQRELAHGENQQESREAPPAERD